MQDPRAKLSTDLVALLADNYVPAQQLLKRIFPPGLLMYLAQRRPPAAPRSLAARDTEQVGPTSSHICLRNMPLKVMHTPISPNVRKAAVATLVCASATSCRSFRVCEDLYLLGTG